MYKRKRFLDPNLVGEEKQQCLYFLTGFGFYSHKSLVINILIAGLGNTDENSKSSAGICSRNGPPKGVPNFHWSFLADKIIPKFHLTGIRLLILRPLPSFRFCRGEVLWIPTHLVGPACQIIYSYRFL